MARLEDGFVQLEVVKQRFDDAFDLAEMLARLIAEKESAGADVSEFKVRLNKAEAEKAQLLEVPPSEVNSGIRVSTDLSPTSIRREVWKEAPC